MVEGIPRAEGELSFVAPHASLMGAFEGTRWEAQAIGVNMGLADPRTAALIGLAIDASVNLAHASGVAEGAGPSPRESATIDGILAGMDDAQVVSYTYTRKHGARDSEVVASQRLTLVEQMQSALTAHEHDDLAVVVDSMSSQAFKTLESHRYDNRPLYQAVAMITRDVCPYRRRPERLIQETRSMVHHFSDSELAPPAVLLTQSLVEGLSHWRDRYMQWAKYADISPTDECYRLMSALLGIGGVRPHTMRQIMALHPDRAEEIPDLVSSHLQEMFLSIAQAPADLLPPVPEARRATNPLRLGAVAGAVGAAAMSRAPRRKPGPKPKPGPVPEPQQDVDVGSVTPLAEDIIEDSKYAAARSRRVSRFGRNYVNDAVTPIEGHTLPKESSVGLSKDLVSVYLDEISHTPLLEPIEEVVLAKAIEAGLYAEQKLKHLKAAAGHPADPELIRDLMQIQKTGEQAKELFWRANLRLVIGYARRKIGRGMAFLDLIQEGNLGVRRAVEKFDYTRGYKFSTYASWWIRQSISHAMADQARTIRIPMHMFEGINQMRGVISDFASANGRDPRPGELAGLLGVDESVVRDMLRHSQEPASLHRYVGSGEDSALGDFVADGDIADPVDLISLSLLKTAIEQVMELLTPRERQVVRLRYGFDGGKPMGLAEIGEVIGCSKETVRNSERAAFKKIRESDGDELLRGLLD